MKVDSFVNELEKELSERYNQCEDYAATPCNILLAVLNAVAGAKFLASQDKAKQENETISRIKERLEEERKKDPICYHCNDWIHMADAAIRIVNEEGEK